MPKFSQKSLNILSHAHPDLQRLFMEVIKEYDCTIVCSVRGKEDQEEAYNNGYSKAHYGESPHNFEPSLAVDVVPYPSFWSDKGKLKELGAIVKIKAIDMEIEITWGGDFRSFKDYPHYELKKWRSMK